MVAEAVEHRVNLAAFWLLGLLNNSGERVHSIGSNRGYRQPNQGCPAAARRLPPAHCRRCLLCLAVPFLPHRVQPM